MKCILPWINYGTGMFGRSRVCGYSNPEAEWQKIFEENGWTWGKEYPEARLYLDGLQNSSVPEQWNSLYFQSIRKTFLKDEWPENCKRCKKVEELGGTSKRMDENDMWWNDEHIKETEYPRHLDVRTGTICNFKCIHCSPAVSSRWSEDIEVHKKYNKETPVPDDGWITKEKDFWNSLDKVHIKRYNFLGGESFYNKRHNEFIKELNESPYAKEIEIAYVSNGSFRFDNMENFKKVRLRLSVDCVETAGEYFRYGLKWDEWCDNIRSFPENFDVSFQWTASNVSMVYLPETFDLLRMEFPHIRFLFENHVDNPPWLSPQNLPKNIKDALTYGHIHWTKMPFYINLMNEEDLWPKYGETFLNYLEDLDKHRGTDWKTSLKELHSALKSK